MLADCKMTHFIFWCIIKTVLTLLCAGQSFFMCEFEEKVKKNLIECGIKPDDTLNGTQKIGLAVSGGADSVSLLLSLSSIFSSLYVITVNHNIRPAEESAGDAQYVSELCKKLQEEKKVQIFSFFF